MIKRNQFICTTLLFSLVMSFHGQIIGTQKETTTLIKHMQHESQIIRRGAKIVQKIVKHEKMSDQDIEDLKKVGRRTAIIAGLTALAMGAGFMLYKKHTFDCLLPISLPDNIIHYNKRQHEMSIRALVNDKETAHKLWAEEKSTSDLVNAILNSVNTKTTYIFTTNNTIQGFITFKDNHIALLAVDQNNRSKGIGSQLLSFAINHLSSKYKTITIDVEPENVRAKTLYERIGFQFAPTPYAPGLLRGTKNFS